MLRVCLRCAIAMFTDNAGEVFGYRLLQ